MLQQDFNIRYCFIEFVDKENNYRLELFPVNEINKGAMNTTFPDGQLFGGEYTIRNEADGLHISFKIGDFIFSPTKLGFDLLTSSGAITYSFTRNV